MEPRTKDNRLGIINLQVSCVRFRGVQVRGDAEANYGTGGLGRFLRTVSEAVSALILPVINGEEERGIWSSNRKQKKNLQVDQEGGFKQRSNILVFSPGTKKKSKQKNK